MPAEVAPPSEDTVVEEPKADVAEEPKAEEPKAEEANTEPKKAEKIEKAAAAEKSRNGTAKSSGAKKTSSKRPSSSRSSSKPGPPLKLPKWCGFPPWHKNRNVRLEVQKDGKKGKSIYLMRRPYFVLGKLPGNEVQLEHPSISRKHAMILHHKVNGTLHLVDLKSAHGTYLREEKIKPGMNNMVTLTENSAIRFGASTRSYVLKGTAQVERSSKTGGDIGPAGPPEGRESGAATQKRKRASEGEYEVVKTVRKALTPAARLMLRRKQQEREALARRENLRKMAGSNKTIITGLTAKIVTLAPKKKKEEVSEPNVDVDARAGEGTGMVDEEEAVVVEDGEKDGEDGAKAEDGAKDADADAETGKSTPMES